MPKYILLFCLFSQLLINTGFSYELPGPTTVDEELAPNNSSKTETHHTGTNMQKVFGAKRKSTPPNNTNNNSSDDRLPSSTLHVHSIGLGLGQTFLRSDLQTHGADQITFDLFYSYSASYSFDFVANAHYAKFTSDSNTATTAGIALGIKAKLFQMDSFSPYLLGGFGFYQPSYTEPNYSSRKDLVFGVHAGAGCELKLNNEFSVGALIHYHDPFDVKQNSPHPPLQASYLKLLMTAAYSFD